MKNYKGITLIALIITIIVMMILVGVSVTIAINGGLFGATREASFKTMMSGYKEQVDTYSMEKRISDYVNDTASVSDINAGATEREPKVEIKEILGTDVKKGYEEKIAVEAGELYYVPVNPTNSGVKEEVKWCFEIGVKVKGYDNYEDYEVGTIPVSDGSYEEAGKIFVNTPDLTGFSKTHTYFVTYDKEGKNETIGEKIIGKIPEGEVWYDYESKIWANVVTINGENTAYWVWIPRYAYKITYYTTEDLTDASPDNEVTQYGNIDVKFLSKDDICKEKTENGEIKQTTLEQLKSEGYKLPESFTWDEKPIAGYWVSKYEVSEGASISFNIEKTANGSIKVFNIKNVNCERRRI